MPTNPLERLLFAQGGKCFFCQRQLTAGEASIEHLVAKANGGGNAEDNCVACCKALNSLLGRMSLKEKLRVILNQKGVFICPGSRGSTKNVIQPPTKTKLGGSDKLSKVIADLQKRGTARPATLKKLASTINALFGKELSENDIAVLVSTLEARHIIDIKGTKVAYNF